MNIKRAFLVLAVALWLPGLAMAGTTTGPSSFEIDFLFDDGNPADITANISCNGGLPLTASQVVNTGDTITFILLKAEASGTESDCRVWVDDVTNYTAGYACDDDDGIACAPASDGCFYEGAGKEEFHGAFGDSDGCVITLAADDAVLRVNKTWEIIGSAGNTSGLDFSGTIEVCTDSDGILLGGSQCSSCGVSGPDDDFCDFTFTGANWQGNVFSIFETNFDSAIEADIGDCVDNPTFNGSEVGGQAGTVLPGGDLECTVNNTVFFEGIPTLNQYGLAIMALLMLGIGFVGFRRFV